MVFTGISIIHHVGIVLVVLWLLNACNCCHPAVYFVSLIYLYQVHERSVMRLKRKLQYEERKQAYQKRALSDSETVRWLNHAVEKIWPVCMEEIVSQKIFRPIIPWFLDKYKPWTVGEAEVQHLYLGRSPPMFTEMRVLHESTDDDHVVLELGMNFLTADDMSAILAARLRKRLGFGIWAKMHLTGMHVEGKVLVGVKFLRQWPFIGRLRVCFAEPPYFQMTVKPFSHGMDVTELPGIAGWLDKLLAIAFEQTLVEPNMLVVDMEKFVSPQAESWFSVDVKGFVGYAKIEVLEGADMKPSDPNGLADPFVKGQLGLYRFRSKIQRKTLTPKWQEEFKIPISSWDSPNILAIQVRDKDRFVDDTLGECSVNISELRDGQRHDMWLPLENIKKGRLHLAITVLDTNEKGMNQMGQEKKADNEEKTNSLGWEAAEKAAGTSASSRQSERVADAFDDTFEAIDVKGQKETGIWVHHPGSEVSQIWEPRKGKGRVLDEIQCEGNNSKDSSSGNNSPDGKKGNPFMRGIMKINSALQRHPKKEDLYCGDVDAVPSPHANVRAVDSKRVGIKLEMDNNIAADLSAKAAPEFRGGSSNEGSGPESSGKLDVKGTSKDRMKHAGKSAARRIKHVLSKKGSKKMEGDAEGREVPVDFDSSDDDSPSSSHYDSSLGGIRIASSDISNNDDSLNSKELYLGIVPDVPAKMANEDPTTVARSGPLLRTVDVDAGRSSEDI